MRRLVGVQTSSCGQRVSIIQAKENLKFRNSPVEDHGERIKVGRILKEGLELGGASRGGETSDGGARHPVPENDAAGAAGLGDGLAAAVGAGDEAPLGGGHGHVEPLPVEQERTGDAHRQLDIPDRQLTALTANGVVVEAVERETLDLPPGNPPHRLATDAGGAAAVAELGLQDVGRDRPGHDGCHDVLVLLRQFLGRGGGAPQQRARGRRRRGEAAGPDEEVLLVVAGRDDRLDEGDAEEAEEVDERRDEAENGEHLGEPDDVERRGAADLLAPPPHQVGERRREQRGEDEVGVPDRQRQRVPRLHLRPASPGRLADGPGGLLLPSSHLHSGGGGTHAVSESTAAEYRGTEMPPGGGMAAPRAARGGGGGTGPECVFREGPRDASGRPRGARQLLARAFNSLGDSLTLPWRWVSDTGARSHLALHVIGSVREYGSL
jgi:hypothetical protein